MKTQHKWLLLIGLVVLLLIGGIAIRANRPGDASVSCHEYFAGMKNPPISALDWCENGDYFSWESTLPQNADFEALNIFHICKGEPDDPAIVMIHGYPTSSYDFAEMITQLSDDFYTCALDTPGYGFSDKPDDGYDYSIFDDARLVDFYLREIIEFDEFTLLTHDKGDSVGLALLQIYQAYDEKPYQINHHFITNGNIYLPLAQLATGQKALLNPISGPVISSLLSGTSFAEGLADMVYATTLPQSEVDSYAAIFDYQDGMTVQHEIIEYLNERSEYEVELLETLGRSDIPTTVIWGELDTIAPVAVADYVWTDYLADRETPAVYWRIPCADHYLQVDTPGLLADVLHATLDDDRPPSEIEGPECEAALTQLNQ